MQKVISTDTGLGFKITVNGRPIQSLAAVPPRGKTRPELAAYISNFTQGVPVTDKTGLEGTYKISLSFTLQASSGIFPDDPDLATALQQQLGLKLEEQKGAIELFFLDHIARPDAN